MVGHEPVPFAPAGLAFLGAIDRPLEAMANALRPGEHAQVQLLDPSHMVGIGRDLKGRAYAYDSARKHPPYGVFQDKDPQDFRRILEEFEKRRQKVVPPYVLKMRGAPQ